MIKMRNSCIGVCIQKGFLHKFHLTSIANDFNNFQTYWVLCVPLWTEIDSRDHAKTVHLPGHEENDFIGQILPTMNIFYIQYVSAHSH